MALEYGNITENVTNELISQKNTTADPWSLMEKMILGTWLTISMICAIFGNIMVIIVVFKHKGMQTRTNMFLVNLAIADFLTGLLIMPFSLATLIKGTWVFGTVVCNINGFLTNLCLITSIHTLMYISIHKYVSITRPFSRILNHWKILLMIFCAWLWAIVCAILTMFVMNRVVYKVNAMQCGPEYPHNNIEYIHHSIIQVTNFFIPLIIMIFAYTSMYREFRKHAHRLRMNTTLQSDQILGQQIQVTKTLFIVLAWFLLCWFPYAVYTTYGSMVKDKDQIPGWANAVAYCFIFMNSGCNPIIYAWRSPSFREGYKEILCQKSGYVVSDDTIRDSDSPSIIRRLSAMLHTSFRTSRVSLHRTSEDATSINSIHISRSTSVSSPTHTLLRRATSKTAKGSSIIRKDGAVIITKNGKIISVRHDSDSIKRDRSFSGFEDIRISQNNGVSRSFSEINTLSRDRIELTPLLQRAQKGSDASGSLTSLQERGHKYVHTSLSKIDSVDENETDSRNTTNLNNNRLCPPNSSGNAVDQSARGVTSPVLLNRLDSSPASSVKSDLDEVFTPPIVLYEARDNPADLKNPVKGGKNLQCASKNIENMSNETNSSSTKMSPGSKFISKSSEIVFDVPLLRCPSVERLDIPKQIPRSSSDATIIRKLLPGSPLYKRRWLSNKNMPARVEELSKSEMRI